MANNKQAVLLIHGIGFQRPMRTLCGFVDTVWTTDDSLRPPKVPNTVWSKPDTVSESFELRRLTTASNTQGVRTDFFEFYWAHLLGGTSLGQLATWLRSLLWRSPRLIPRPLKAAYYILWIVVMVVGVVLLNAALPEAHRFWEADPVLSVIVSTIVLPGVTWVLREIVGDAAVYLDAAPSNIQTRHEIRSAGVKLLKTLHERGYERIIVVGHSLGTVIGYDVLKYAWAEMHDDFDPLKAPSEKDHLELQLRADNLEQSDSQEDRNDYIRAQRTYFDRLVAAGGPWRVSDFVTLGSPLAHSEALLSRGVNDLKQQIERRELPTSPAFAETSRDNGQVRRQFWFERRVKVDTAVVTYCVPHHAAVFAPTVWTNLYFPCRRLIWGDLIGGPVATQLGVGIRDIPVETRIWGGLLSHTFYWTARDGDTHVAALRQVLALAR
jgi:hypothetical protein